MSTAFPSALDNFTNPTASDYLDTVPHTAQHANINDAVEALEAKVGITNSAVTSSLDYKVSTLELYNVLLAGAAGDGITDDTVVIQGVIDAAAVAGGTVYFPPGTYLVSDSLILYSDVYLLGAGKGASTIKLANGSDVDVLLGDNAYALFGTNATGILRFGVKDLTIDCNGNNQSPADPDLCNGITFYGTLFNLENIEILNVAGHGMRTEWQQFGETTGGLESVVRNVIVDTCERSGWWNKGPHDISVHDFIVIDASQETNDTYYGLHIVNKAGGRYYNFHAWHRSATTNRMKLNLFTEQSSCEFVNCTFEGGRQLFQTSHNGQKFTSCLFYAGSSTDPFCVLTANDTVFVDCEFTNNGSATASYAIQIGDGGTAVGGTQVIGGHFFEFGANTPFNFVNDAGDGIYIATGYSTSGSAFNFGGTVDTDNVVMFSHKGSAIYTKRQVWADPFGDVVGPATATDNAIARYDGTTGNLVQDSGVTVDDTDAIQNVTAYYTADGVTFLEDAHLALDDGDNADLTTGGLAFSAPANVSATELSLTATTDMILSTPSLNLTGTITAGGTTGARTIDKPCGSVNFAAAATSLVVTNSNVSTSSIVLVQLQSNDATMTDARVEVGSGSFTIRPDVAPTSEARVSFIVINTV